jgi:hypothetical protein
MSEMPPEKNEGQEGKLDLYRDGYQWEGIRKVNESEYGGCILYSHTKNDEIC